METKRYKEFMDLVRDRYSCRDYSNQEVTAQAVDMVLDAARLAPSACNRQPWTFYVVRDADQRHAMLAKSRPAFLQAPVLIVAVGHHDQAWHRPADDKDHTDVDVSIAVEHICLGATALGLATCWVCSFDTEAVKKTLNLKDTEEAIALIPLGYPANEATDKNRKSLSEIVKNA